MKHLFTLLVLPLFFVIGCKTNDENNALPTPQPQTNNVLTKIAITSPNGSHLNLNESITLSVQGFDQAYDKIEITGTIEWSVNNDNLMVDQNGKITAAKAGTSIVTAKTDNLKATYKIYSWTNGYTTEVYVSDAGNFEKGPYQLLKLDENGQNPVAFTTGNLAWPQDILFLEDQGVALISNLNGNSIGRFDITTGNYIDNFASGISGPTRIKIGPDGLVYALQWQGDGLVYRYKPDGTFVDKFTSIAVPQAIGLDWDLEGNLYVSSYSGGNNGFIRKFNNTGQDLGLFISNNANLNGPTNIWFDGSGDLLVNDYVNGVVRRFDSKGNFIANALTNLQQPEGISFLDENFLVGSTRVVKMYDSNGNFVKDLVTGNNLLNVNAVVVRYVAK